MLRQRQPRQSDLSYLKWLRTQSCVCGCYQGPPCDAAHLRARSHKYGKDEGGGRRPDDRWALPLKHAHHMAQHAHGNELEWWTAHGVSDPFALCIEYQQRYNRSKK